MARSALAQATSFAHLIGIGRTPRAAEDDDERKQKEGESDADYKDRMDKLDGKQGSKPKTQDEDEEMEEIDDERKRREGESDEDYQERMDELDEADAAAARRASRKAKLADGDDADEADDADPKASAARRRERARCAAIFASPAAAKRPDIAAHLAFGTSLTRTAAINTLTAVAAGERQGADPKAGLRSRMAREPQYEVGTEEERKPKSGPDAFAAKMVVADRKRRGLV